MLDNFKIFHSSTNIFHIIKFPISLLSVAFLFAEKECIEVKVCRTFFCYYCFKVFFKICNSVFLKKVYTFYLIQSQTNCHVLGKTLSQTTKLQRRICQISRKLSPVYLFLYIFCDKKF